MHFNIKSKIYVEPKKKHGCLVTLLNISVVIITLLSILSIIGEGFKVSNITPVLIAFFVVSKSKSWLRGEPYFVFSIANVIFGENIHISYQTGQEVTIYKNTISSIEYSDEIECLQFISDYDEKTQDKETSYKQGEFLFFINEKENKEFFIVLEREVGKNVRYIERTDISN